MSAIQKPICVVMDANIWLKDSNLLLKTAIGSALLYTLKEVDGKIGLPSIVEEEITRHIIAKGVKAAELIQKNFKNILVIMGYHEPYTVPSETEIKLVVEASIKKLENLFHRIPFSFEHAESALKKINEKLPPSDPHQQFKDCAIWEATLELSSSYTVYFVTEDQAFYKGKTSQINNLAKNLYLECQRQGGIVHIYPDLASCLKEIQKARPPFDLNCLIVEIDSNLNSRLKRDLAREYGFEVGNLAVELSSVLPFFTENHNKWALTFELSYYCYDIENTGIEERVNAILKAKGDCFYAVDTHIISQIELDFQRIHWVEPSGELGQRGAVYLSSQKTTDLVMHTVREPIDFIRNPELNEKQRSETLLTKKTDVFQKYSEDEKAILLIFLNKYSEGGSEGGIKVFRHATYSLTKYSEFHQYGDVTQILKLFGGQEKLEEALRHLQNLLYSID